MRVNKTALYGALQILTKVADGKSLPVLSCIKLEAENGNLKLTSTDLNRTLSTTIPAQGNIETVLPAQLIYKIVKPESKKDAGDVIINTLDQETVLVRIDGLETKLTSTPVEDFPMAPDGDWEFIGMLDAQVLNKALGHVVPTICKDETRPQICCLAFIDDKAIGTDGHRLGLGTLDTPIDEPLVVPGDSARLLSCITNFTGLVTVEKTDTHAQVKAGQWTLITKTIDTEFIPYESVIPTASSVRFSVDKKAFSKALKRVGSLSKGKGIRMTINGVITLASNDPEFGEARIEVTPVENYHNGPDLIAGFEMAYLLDAVGKGNGTARFSMNGQLDPVRVDLDGELTSVVMPMRI